MNTSRTHLGLLAVTALIVGLGIFWTRHHLHRAAGCTVGLAAAPMPRAMGATSTSSPPATPAGPAQRSDSPEQPLARQIPAAVVAPPARGWGTQTPAIPVQPLDPQTTRPPMANPGGVNGARPPR